MSVCVSVCLLSGLAWAGAGSAAEDPWSSGNWGGDVVVVPPQTPTTQPSGGRPTPPPTTSTPSTSNSRPSNPTTTPSNPTTTPSTPSTTPTSSTTSAGINIRGTGVRPEPADEATSTVFNPNTILTYNITVNASDLARIDRNPKAEERIRGSVAVNDRPYSPISFRYKGSIGAFLAPCTGRTSLIGLGGGAKIGKCSIKLEFDQYDDDLRLHGLKTINLHSMGHDESMMKERLGYAMYREMGIAAPRTAYARVMINGRLEGLFLAVEQIDSTFTRARFEDGGEGNVYKEVWPMYDTADTYRKALETNESAGDVDRMVRFKEAIDRGANAALPFLNRLYTTRYLAVDRVIMNDDGIMHWYCGSQQGNNERRAEGNHNYYWYEGRNQDRFWLVPWDLDSSFENNAFDFVHVGTEWFQPDLLCLCTPVGGVPQRAPSCDPLIRILGQQRDDYDDAVTEFIDGPFSARNVNAKLEAWTAQISSAVSEAAGVRSAPSARAWRDAVTRLRSVIDSARRNRGFNY